ncbi:MAG: LysM peptidoglycan-binding domain-containing protein [Planctomycetes bacterium]|nr:LysM peptidoglycan-binding domain-containing protein [Planctomycetota bacterium]
MRNTILTVLVGFVLLTGSILLIKLGLDGMTDAAASPTSSVTSVQVDLQRKEILYRVAPGDTLWALADRFYGSSRRWPEIAAANSIKEGEGLLSGRLIRIPLAVDAEIAPPAPAASTVDIPREEPAARPFAIDESALGATLCRPDAARFPSGVICVARAAEDLSVSLNIFDAAGEVGATPLSTYTAPAGEQLQNVFTVDANADGAQEIVSVWRRGEGACWSRVFALRDGKLELVSETPDDPIAVLHRRNAK